MIVNLPAGVVNERSRRSNVANWREVNLIRWEGNTIQPMGGWEALNYTPFASKVRAIHRWIGNDGKTYLAYLCEEHCYIDVGDGALLDITPVDGLAPSPVTGLGGYGDLLYGADEYGTPRNSEYRFNVSTPAYTLDNWGEELRAMTSNDGRLLGWSPQTPATPLSAITNAPTSNHTFSVVPERHIILYGADGVSQQFKWSDQEDDTDWTPTTTSKAGGFYVEPAAPIFSRQQTPAGVLMFTSRMAYLIRYIGLPYVFSYEPVSECSPPYSPAAITLIPDGAFWASVNGFWLYNGVNTAPLDCPIWDWIQERIDPVYSRFASTMINVKSKFEAWFFFSGRGSPNNTYVAVYNYKYKRWAMGVLGRTCGISVANDPNPIMSNGTKIFKHESGFQYPGSSMPWAETFTMNLASGSRLSTIMQMLPEIDGSRSAVQFKFVKRNDPTNGPEVVSPAKMIRDNGFVDVRETARDFRMRLEMIENDDWSMGPVDIAMVTRGAK